MATRLIAVFYPPCEKQVTTVSGDSNQVPFRAKGVRIIEPGWTVLYPRKLADKKDDEQELPDFRPGESGPHEPLVRRGETTPPKSYTEASLLGAMETAGKLVDDDQLREALRERGLGTPATRAAIIEMLIHRGYIVRDQKILTATDPGRYLIALVQDRNLKSPELTGEWEASLRGIERGEGDPRRFMEEIVKYTREVIRSGESLTTDESRLGDCPRCGRPVIEGKRGFGCSGWRDGCPFVLWREFQGHSLTIEQIRTLLQHRVLLSPLPSPDKDKVPVILQLLDSGDLSKIPVPVGKPRGPAVRNARRSSSGRKGTRAANKAPAYKESPAESKADLHEVSLGPCPLCKANVVEQDKSFRCRDWRNGCKFTIWKTIAGKRISARTAQALLRDGTSPKLKGFASKSGRSFDARLKLDGGEVRFDFG